ncbi:glycosyltransferase [Granulicella cerasi]|uniref:Glycosyltransferase n=1 Tax=Granulicella cerasi TaxID=741063 RepID=A0ABW1ZE84_9BACT|nr:glycosyltransferase family 2 protein [Granulicella cerasi]
MTGPSSSSWGPLHEAPSETTPLDLAVVVPTYNESANVLELIQRLEKVLAGLHWEVIFVDDDSPDGTADIVRKQSARNPRVRLVHRIGRRGLSSACIEGILATSSRYVVIMDGDMQHDEAIVPQMLTKMRDGGFDIVVGTRNAEGGSMGEFSKGRVRISRLGQRVSNSICRCDISDPMSGFFLVDRRFFRSVVRSLHGGGFKILVDMLASSSRPVRFAEVGYTFRTRRHGKSKLDVNTAVEYFFLIIDKATHRLIPARFAAFSLVGAAGAATHLLCVWVMLHLFHVSFVKAQIAATYIAMTENFFLNNLITWRDRSLRGLRLVTGLLSFWIACSFGAWANVIFARALLNEGMSWYFASLAGIVLSSVWNYSISNLFTWQKKPARMTEINMVDEAY